MIIDTYCLKLLKKTDKDRYLSVLFAPKAKRNALAALYAFNAEIAHIRESIREPLVGEIKLRWWRDALMNNGIDGADGHPILFALLKTIDEYHLPLDAFLRYCDARIFDLYNDPMPSVNDLEGYCGETSSAIIQLACQILDPDAALISSDACGHAGVALAISVILRLLPIYQARHQLYIPTDIINAAGGRLENFINNKASDQEKQQVLLAFFALLQDHYSQFLENYAALPKTLRPAFTPLAIVPAILNKSQNMASDVFNQGILLSPLQRYWLITKAAMGRFSA